MDEPRAIVAAGYDRLASRYLDWSARTVDPARERMVGELITRLPRGHSLLDLGCGAGVPTTGTLAQRYAVTGVDVSSAQLAAARANVPTATFIEADIASIDFAPESFDAVTALYVISHVPREHHANLFGRIARWLRPNGLFVASLGAGDSPDWTGDWLGVPMFFSSFDAAENERLLTAAGFELDIAEVVETLEPEAAVPFLWVLARVTVRSG
jgi:SAM-dependent methyltransferase